ncbi:D-2-hydroxyacid dehydrogenase [Ramlibacter sp. 2FC]|uniref:D-2-hydroxyacid dehydrogenase n=1 Tax=Ramlibacter sp. 2FC TaxID=2502188 RepID=UPI0010F6D662|nr:D-2-hydroxyacid dehydrogenase [Ramlibacter sp. 2FC]
MRKRNPLVLVNPPFSQVDETRLAELRAVAPLAEIRSFTSEEEMEPFVADADVIAGRLSEPLFQRASSLKWLHSWLAGPDHQLFPTLVDSDVLFTCSKGNGAIPLAEHAMMLMLLLNRDAMKWFDSQRARKWERRTHSELCGKTVGILGTGHSGQDLAIKAKAFHMRVLGVSRSGRALQNFDQVFPISDLHLFLQECDVLVNAAPLTPETRGMLGEAEFRRMKRTAHYICFSRGGIADDDALLRALNEGWIAGAGLDAHTEEPLPPGSPFWTAPNTIVTPHNGATTWETYERSFTIFRDNLARFSQGLPLSNVVDKRAGY